MELKKIAEIRTSFPEKFGIPRQSGLAGTLGKVIFEPEYRNREALRGIEEYSHLWLVWGFSEVKDNGWHPTVRPPRLGGNKRVGVFATRSPFRPNPIGLSCVELIGIEETEAEGTILLVRGVDMMDASPVYDIKPYLPYVDAKPEARGSFSDRVKETALRVDIPEKWIPKIPEKHRQILEDILSQDPRPSYQDDPERVYGMSYENLEIKFRVNEGQLTVCGIEAKEC